MVNVPSKSWVSRTISFHLKWHYTHAIEQEQVPAVSVPRV